MWSSCQSFKRRCSNVTFIGTHENRKWIVLSEKVGKYYCTIGLSVVDSTGTKVWLVDLIPSKRLSTLTIAFWRDYFHQPNLVSDWVYHAESDCKVRFGDFLWWNDPFFIIFASCQWKVQTKRTRYSRFAESKKPIGLGRWYLWVLNFICKETLFYIFERDDLFGTESETIIQFLGFLARIFFQY